MSFRYVPAPDAEETIEEIASPALVDAATALAPAIVEKVPVESGAVKREYQTGVAGGTSSTGGPQARVTIGSPRWHFLEYGTQFNPPYRPIQTAAEALGLRYEPK